MKRAAAALGLAMIAALAHADERRIYQEVVVKAPVEEVWKAWSTSEGVQSFFGPEARVEAKPGGAFNVHFNPYAPPGLKGADDMQVLAVQENRLISFTWNAPPHLPQARAQRTFVTVRMQPVGSGETQVRLQHGGWGDGGEWEQAYDYFEKAWPNVLASLQKRFVEGPVDWTPWLAQMKARQSAK